MEEYRSEPTDTSTTAIVARQQTRLDVALDLREFIREVARDPKGATPESVAALPEVANVLNLILCEVH